MGALSPSQLTVTGTQLLIQPLPRTKTLGSIVDAEGNRVPIERGRDDIMDLLLSGTSKIVAVGAGCRTGLQAGQTILHSAFEPQEHPDLPGLFFMPEECVDVAFDVTDQSKE